jgi:scyllo-inositol 2-dehydrogenase (NADP+)
MNETARARRQGPLQVGLIGYGLAGSVFHAPLIAATPDLCLTAVVTADPGRAQQVREQHPQARVLADSEALFSRDFDLIVIASSNRSHAPLAMRALQAGLAVVVDKPLAVTTAEATALAEFAAARGLLLTVFHNRRWDSEFLTVQQLIADGVLGKVHRFESRFERWRPQLRAGWRQQSDPAEGGGVLLDLGSHLIDQAVQLFGPVQRVHAELDCRHPEATVEDDAFVALRHVSGTRSHLWMSSRAIHAGPRLRVLGDRAAYVKPGLDGQEDALRAGMRADDPRLGAEPESEWGQLIDARGAHSLASLRGRWCDYYPAVARALRTGAAPPVSAHDAVEVLRLCEAARACATQQR